MATALLGTLALPAAAQQAAAADAAPAATADEAAEAQTLARELEALKSSYAAEVRRLRDIDVRVQALQARLAGKTTLGSAAPGKPAAPSNQTPPAEAETYAGTQAEARQSIKPQRSVEDVLQQEHALFNRPLTLEAGITYGHYDRRELTLNGFLALDAIFLGNIAIQGIKSDSLTYDFAARYGVTPRLTLNVDVPFIQRWTNYQKGGAGGSAAALAEENTTDPPHVGDINASANFRLFAETPSRPDVVLTGGFVAPTGRAPYGIDVRTIEAGDNTSDSNGNNDNNFVRFAVPSQQATGNGLWAVNIGASAVKTMDPAIVFGSVGYQHYFQRHFGDVDTSPDTTTPGRVELGDNFTFGAGLAFAFNDRTSMSLSFVDKIVREARIKIDGQASQPIIGSLGNIGTLNVGLTYALTPHLTWVTLLGVGLTPDAPDFTLNVKLPYQF
ncbi:MAG: hypothetical protein EPN38_02305 [Rhodanobacteraceae bacterium]|nr:MAG: hypothetical protein EPN38_02305 [Rhodanobacteraceae bacterium]